MLRFNDPEGARTLLSLHAHKLAAIVIDPMPSRAGLIKPDPEFIDAVQEAARTDGILIIADEVLNLRQGFRSSAARYGLVADLFAMGKKSPKRFRKETVIPILKDMRDPAISSARQTLTIGTADLEAAKPSARAPALTRCRGAAGIHDSRQDGDLFG